MTRLIPILTSLLALGATPLLPSCSTLDLENTYVETGTPQIVQIGADAFETTILGDDLFLTYDVQGDTSGGAHFNFTHSEIWKEPLPLKASQGDPIVNDSPEENQTQDMAQIAQGPLHHNGEDLFYASWHSDESGEDRRMHVYWQDAGLAEDAKEIAVIDNARSLRLSVGAAHDCPETETDARCTDIAVLRTLSLPERTGESAVTITVHVITVQTQNGELADDWTAVDLDDQSPVHQELADIDQQTGRLVDIPILEGMTIDTDPATGQKWIYACRKKISDDTGILEETGDLFRFDISGGFTRLVGNPCTGEVAVSGDTLVWIAKPVPVEDRDSVGDPSLLAVDSMIVFMNLIDARTHPPDSELALGSLARLVTMSTEPLTHLGIYDNATYFVVDKAPSPGSEAGDAPQKLQISYSELGSFDSEATIGSNIEAIYLFDNGEDGNELVMDSVIEVGAAGIVLQLDDLDTTERHLLWIPFESPQSLVGPRSGSE